MSFEIIGHTADVGLTASAATLEETFTEATRALCTISGTWNPGPGVDTSIEVDGGDVGAVLVDWLGEIVYLQDARDSVVAGVQVTEASDTAAKGFVTLAPRGEASPEGTAVKAITYHQLSVTPIDSGWTARVFVDV